MACIARKTAIVVMVLGGVVVGATVAGVATAEPTSSTAVSSETDGPSTVPGDSEHAFSAPPGEDDPGPTNASESFSPDDASVDAITVWEEGQEIKYSLYGHQPATPTASQEISEWQWWSLEDDTHGTLGEGTNPQIAFSREGWAMAVWAYEGSEIRYSRFDGESWSDPQTLAAPEDDFAYVTDPAVAFDVNGTGLAVWQQEDSNGYSINAKYWDGNAWTDTYHTIGDSPSDRDQPGRPEIAFTSQESASVSSAKTRHSAVVVWRELVSSDERPEKPCDTVGEPVDVQVTWPAYAIWNGSGFSTHEMVPGAFGDEGYPRESIFTGKLGVAPDQHGNATIAWGATVRQGWDSSTCQFTDQSVVVRSSEWKGDNEQWEDPTRVRSYDPEGFTTATVDVAYLPNGETVIADGETHPHPSLAAMHTNHNETLAVWRSDDDSGVTAAAFDHGDALPQDGTPISSGDTPEIATRAGSPTMPLAEWSYIGYFAADNNLHNPIVGPGDSDRSEMQSASSTNLVNTVLLSDPNTSFGPAPFPNGNVQYEYVTAGTTRTLETHGDLNTGDGETLEAYLAYAIEHYPADRYVLDMGDHGEGWRQQCQDGNSGDWMQLDEFDRALDNSTETIDLLVFSECLMAQLEVAHEVDDDAEIMIASEEKMPGAGPNYARRLGNLTDDPHQSDRTLATRMVSIYADENNGEDTTSALDLSAVPATSDAVDAFAEALLATDSENQEEIVDAREATETFAPGHNLGYKDLGHYASIVNRTVPDPEIQAAAQQVNERLDDLVIAEWHGPERPNATGVSIYLEPMFGTWLEEQPEYNSTTFGEDTRWDTFVGNQTTVPSVTVSIGGSSRLRTRSTDDAGNTCGLGYSGVTGRCSLPLVEGECSAVRRGQQALMVHPPTESLTYEINGSLLEEATDYTVTVKVIQGKQVVERIERNGTIAPEEVVSETVETGVPGPPPVVGDDPPRDLDGNGLYEDINGDGQFTIADVQLLFRNRDSDVIRNNARFFNFDERSPPEVTITDVQVLFLEYSGS